MANEVTTATETAATEISAAPATETQTTSTPSQGEETIPPNEAGAEVPAEGDVPASTEQPKIDQELLDRAKELGLEGEFSQEQLKSAVLAFDRRFAQLGQEALTAQQQRQTQPQQPVQQQPVQQRQPVQQVQYQPIKLDRAMFGEPVAAVLEEIINPLQQQAATVPQMQQVIGYLGNQIQRANAQYAEMQAIAATQRFDGLIANLPKEYETVLGKGGIDELDPKSPFRAVRDELSDQMDALQAGYERSGHKMPSEKEVFRRALAIVTADRTAQLERQKIAAQLKKRAGVTIARPQGRRTATTETKGQKAAEIAVEQFFEQHT